MDKLSLVNQQLQPGVFYRPVDISEQVGIPISDARKYLRRLAQGDCVDCTKQGAQKIYITKQMSLI